MLKRIKQIVPGEGGRVTFSRRAEAGRPGSVKLEVDTDAGAATVDFTLTPGGQLWANTRNARGQGSSVSLPFVLDIITGQWTRLPLDEEDIKDMSDEEARRIGRLLRETLTEGEARRLMNIDAEAR